MADRRISELQEILASEVRADSDVLALADISASETRKIKVAELAAAGINGLADGSINGSVLEDGSVNNSKLEDGTVTGDKIANDTITGDHIAPDAITSSELADGAVDTDSIQDDAVTGDKIADSALGRGIDKQSDVVGHEQSYFPGAPATFAGVTVDEYGHVSSLGTEIPATDLPIATDAVNGVSHYPASSGLSVSGTGAVSHTNTVTADTKTKITYDSNGHVTAGGDLESADLPLATATEPGAVSVPGPTLSVDASGALTHASSSVVPGTYPKVTVDEDGHVTAGLQLEASDIPDLSFDQITSGEIPPGALGECAINAPNICDYATCLMQEDNPGAGDFLGQFWYTPSTAQLRVYSRGSGPENLWLPVGFGALQANNLRWGGTYNADTDTIVSVTSIGTSEGITSGQAFPAATNQLSGLYFICVVEGSGMSQPALDGITHTAGDWALCLDENQGWIHIDVNGGGGGGGGAQRLTDLLDVEIGGAASPFSGVGDAQPMVAIAADQILRYDGDSGLWRNTDIIDGGSID